MSRRTLTPAADMEIKRLYSLKKPNGAPLHSQMEIAAMMGVSETTVFRSVHRRGAYLASPELKTDEGAKASEDAFRAAHPQMFGAEGKMVAAIQKEKKSAAIVEETLTDLTKLGGAYDFVQREENK